MRSLLRKRYVIVLLAALLILVAAAFFIHSRSTQNKPASDQTAVNEAKRKKQLTQSQSKNGSNTDADAAQQNIDNSTKNPDNLNLSAQQSDGNVVIQTKLTGYSDGTCTLTANNGSRSYTQEADVIYAPNFSTCAGFSIPVSRLGSGDWAITLTVTSAGNTQSKAIGFKAQ